MRLSNNTYVGLKGSLHGVLVLAGAEVTADSLPGVGMCFGLVLNAESIIQEVFCYC